MARGRWVATAAAVGAVLIAAAATARAGGLAYGGWGVRGGFSSDPDQFVVGMHIDLGEPAQNLHVVPNADIGFGDNFTIVTVNPDVTYDLPIEGAGTVYFGGSIGLVYWNWDYSAPFVPGYAGPGPDTDGFDLGVAGIAGYRFPLEGNPLAVDLKIGITDEYPDLKLMLVYTFKE